jgi:SlyX protein
VIKSVSAKQWPGLKSRRITIGGLNYLRSFVAVLHGKNNKWIDTMTEERLMEIEIKISRQEDLLESLNQVVYQQQKKIDYLEGMLAALAKHVKQSQDNERELGGLDPTNEKPPHY